MEVFKLPLGQAVDLQWMEPATLVFAYCWDGFVHGVRRTHPEEEPDDWLEREAADLRRRWQAERNLDKGRRNLDT